MASAKSSVVEPFETVPMPIIIEETQAKTEQPLERLVHDVLLADNKSVGTMTTAPEQKSRVSEVSMTVNEELLPDSHTVEPLLVSAVDEHRAESKTVDLATTSSPITSKLEEPTDVAGHERLETGIQSPHADLHAVTERIKPSEVFEDRPLPLDTAISTVIGRDITIDLNEVVSEEMSSEERNEEFSTADWSLTALRFVQSDLQTDVLSTTDLTVQSDVVPEVDETDIGPANGEGKTEMELNGREKKQAGLCDDLHDAETSVEEKPKESLGSDKSMICADNLKQDADAFEEAHRPKKKVAALILDTDTVHIHTTEVLGSTDHKLGIDSTSNTLSQQLEQLATSDETRKEFDSHTSLDQQGLENTENVDSAKSGHPPEENIDRHLPPLVLAGQTSESRNSEPNITHAEREGSWTTNSGQQEVQRMIAPLEHLTVNNGPLETQHRYIVLERQEIREISQEPAAETSRALDADTSKPGGVVTNGSELEVTENVEQVVSKESLETKDSERVALNAKEQCKTLEIMVTLPVPPARRISEELSFGTEDKLVEQMDKVILEVETKPTPPTRRSKEHERFSVSSEVQLEDAKLPVNQYKHDETQLPPAEFIPTPPNRRHKSHLEEERLSLDLHVQPTPPERTQKEKAEQQQLELCTSITVSVEEHLVEPTLPVRQLESDSTSVVSKSQIMGETPVKPTPPTRKRDSRIVIEPVSDSSNLDKTRTEEVAVEESLEKPTVLMREKASTDESAFITPLSSIPQRMEEVLLKPTPPTRRKNGKSVRDTLSKEMAGHISQGAELERTVMQERDIEELLVKPTPPVRRKGSQVSQIIEMEEILVKPTPPARRRDSRIFSDRAYEEMARKNSSSTELERTVTPEKGLEEPIIKPTPPVRRKLSSPIESDTVSVLSKIQEVGGNVVKPTPPTRRRDSRNVSDIVVIKYSSSTDLEKLVAQEKAHEDSLTKPTPPVRRKASQIIGNVISVGSNAQAIEATLSNITPPIRRRSSENMTDTAVSRVSGSADFENSTSVTPERTVEETPPTQPLIQKASQAESDITAFDKAKEMEETLVKPTPPTRRRDSKNVSDMVVGSSDVEKVPVGPLIEPTPPVNGKPIEIESDLISVVCKPQEIDETKVKSTPPRRRDDLDDLESSVMQDSTAEGPKLGPTEETLVKPKPPIFRKDSRNVNETVPKQKECEFSSSNDLGKTMSPERADVEALVKQFPPEGQETCQVSDIIIVDKTQETEETLQRPTPPMARRDVDETVPEQTDGEIGLDRTLTEERADEEDLIKQIPPVGQEPRQVESDVASVVSKAQELEETLVKPTPPARRGSKINSTITDVSQSEVQEDLIEPALSEKDNKVECEHIKPSCVGTEPEDALPKSTTPIDQKMDTTATGLDTVSIKVEEPQIQPPLPTENMEKNVEIQPTIKKNDEGPENELCSALSMESTEGLTENESISLVEVTGNCMHVRDVPGIGVWSL